MANAFVHSTVLAESLLKSGEDCEKTRAALKQCASARLPVYAIKELEQGPLFRLAWLHNKLAELRSFKKTQDFLQNNLPEDSFAQSVLAAMLSIQGSFPLPINETPNNQNPDLILCERFRLMLKALIWKAWRSKRAGFSEISWPLDCYLEKEPQERDGLILISQLACTSKQACSLEDALKDIRDNKTNCQALLRNIPSEEKQKFNAIRDWLRKPKQKLTHELCNALSPIIYAVLSPQEALILANAPEEIRPFAEILGKSVSHPHEILNLHQTKNDQIAPQPHQLRKAHAMTPEQAHGELLQVPETENEMYLELLKEQIHNPMGVVPYVGAGLSAPFGYPIWKKFLEDCINKYPNDKPKVEKALNKWDYELAAELVMQALGETAFHEKVKFVFGLKKLEGKDLLAGAVSYLPELAKGPVITTNYDPVLEEVFKKKGKAFHVAVWGSHHADTAMANFNNNKQVLVKLHGDYQSQADRVLTRSEYETQYGSNGKIDESKPLPNLLRMLLQNRSVLFLGCGLNQDRTLTVLKNVVDNNIVNHFAILEKPADSNEFNEKRKRLDKLKIRPIWYPAGKYEFLAPIMQWLLNIQGSASPSPPTPPPPVQVQLQNNPAPPPVALSPPLEFANRIGGDWEKLATHLNISWSDQNGFKNGNQPQDLMAWLRARSRLGELGPALVAIGRDDLNRDGVTQRVLRHYGHP